jgi:hypothetical protein
MSIADKLTIIAENVSKVYEAGKKAGGGGGTTGRQTKEGIFRLDANATTPTIEHKCGFIPTLFIVYPISEYVAGDLMILGCVMTNTKYFSNVSFAKSPNVILEGKATSVEWVQNNTNAGQLTEDTAILGYAVGARPWKAGFQYGWLAIE